MALLNTPNPPMSEIEPGIFIGDLGSSYNVPSLAAKNITAIVSLSNVQSAYWSMKANREQVPEERHLFISALDNSTQDLLPALSEACDFIEEKSRDGNVLVHCTMGVSRSATIVIAYLMRKHCRSLETTIDEVRGKRRVRPNPNFMSQLSIWAETGYEIWADPAKMIPKPPYTAFLERRTQRLKEKGFTGNEPIFSRRVVSRMTS